MESADLNMFDMTSSDSHTVAWDYCLEHNICYSIDSPESRRSPHFRDGLLTPGVSAVNYSYSSSERELAFIRSSSGIGPSYEVRSASSYYYWSSPMRGPGGDFSVVFSLVYRSGV